MKKHYVFLFFLFLLIKGYSQTPLNAFAGVTAISGKTITVSNVNEANHSFEDGDFIIIMQMQDNVIGTNTTNATTFGDLGAIQSAGLFEVAKISSHVESASIPTSIVLANNLTNTYNINTNAAVQLITLRYLGANYTTSANIGTLAWNGTVGGVTALLVDNKLTLNHSITANSCGFRGGAKNSPDGYSACNSTTYVATLSQPFAGKGEGIYKNTTAGFTGARGKMLNGGGGGNDVNAGGGGGGNYLAGGGGGSGWTGSAGGCSPICGGLGGLSLNSSISSSRVFMGGGGGGGHENDNNGSPGVPGGGIIFIKTSTLVTSASCSGIAISANGGSATSTTNDGAGGGGAGGSIIMQVSSYSVVSACQLTLSANGGNGGNSNTGGTDSHGGGGGGGQGVVIYSTAQPTTNITTNTVPGTGGTSCSGCSSSSNGTTGTGTTNSGIVPNGTPGPLPVELLSFNAMLSDQNDVLIKWATAIEKNSDRFVLQRMNDKSEIIDLATIKCKGNYSSYNYTDMSAENGNNYYRLKQVDDDGSLHFRNWVSVSLSKTAGNFVVYPNPLKTSQNLILECTNLYNHPMQFELIDLLGRLKISETVTPDSNDAKYTIETSSLGKGVYFMRFTVNGTQTSKKIVITD